VSTLPVEGLPPGDAGRLLVRLNHTHRSGIKRYGIANLSNDANGASLFLHRRPLSSSDASRFLRYDEVERNSITYPRIEMPLGDGDRSAPGRDALTRFVELYRAINRLLALAAQHAPHGSAPRSFLVRSRCTAEPAQSRNWIGVVAYCGSSLARWTAMSVRAA
jgi:hypothetical protein